MLSVNVVKFHVNMKCPCVSPFAKILIAIHHSHLLVSVVFSCGFKESSNVCS